MGKADPEGPSRELAPKTERMVQIEGYWWGLRPP